MRVLISETNWNSMTAAAGLEEAGFLVTRVNDGRELTDFAEFGAQNAIVVDADLPDMDAIRLIEHLRERNPLTPIYLLMKDDDWKGRCAAYDAGVDDVLIAPVHPAALAAQIRAGVRRTSGYSSRTVSVGALVLDTDLNAAQIGGNTLQLTRKEYEILELLVLHRERLVTREVFMNHLYAWEDEPDARIINVYLSRIRHQIETCGGAPEMLETVWGLGYRISATAPEKQAA